MGEYSPAFLTSLLGLQSQEAVNRVTFRALSVDLKVGHSDDLES